MSLMYWKSLILLSILASHVYAIKILAIVSIPLGSHYMAFKPLFHELAKRGHSVTVMNHFPDNETTPNLRYVDLQGDLYVDIMTLETYENKYASLLHIGNYFHHLVDNAERVNFECDILFLNENAKAHYAERHKYDVIFVEQFMGDCALMYAATMYDAPIIGITSHVLLPWSYQRLGIPFNPAADAFYFSSSGSNPSLYGRVEATLGYYFFNTLFSRYRQSLIYESFRQHLPHLSFDFDSLVMEKMKMVFSYQHYSMTGARLLAPQLLEIAGAHISTPKPVPKDIEEFLSTADHGAIYVSFGSNLKMASMSPQKMLEFLRAFKRIPQKVLWKWENDSFPAGHDNILAKNWFPQLDVLCHPKVLAFVSHGGMLSMSEAAYCGKPMVVVPFFGDQFTNAAAATSSGLGIFMHFKHITEQSLYEAIEKLTSEEMQQSAKRVSELFNDRPTPAMDSAIYWTEYVARHRAAPPALPATRSAWFETMLLDVAIVIVIILAIIVWMCYIICKVIKIAITKVFGKLVCRKSERKGPKKKSQ